VLRLTRSRLIHNECCATYRRRDPLSVNLAIADDGGKLIGAWRRLKFDYEFQDGILEWERVK